MVHGLVLFSDSAEMEGKGRAIDHAPRAWLRASFASRLSVVGSSVGLSAHLSFGTAEDGLDG